MSGIEPNLGPRQPRFLCTNYQRPYKPEPIACNDKTNGHTETAQHNIIQQLRKHEDTCICISCSKPNNSTTKLISNIQGLILTHIKEIFEGHTISPVFSTTLSKRFIDTLSVVVPEDRARYTYNSREADGSHAGDQGGLAPPQQPHPDIKQPSPPGSDKPPTSARSGGQRSMSDRRQSATRRSGNTTISKASRIKSDSSMSRPGSHHKVGSQRGSPQPHEETEEQPPREPTPGSACSIYMHAIEWLLEVKAIPFTERALAHELLSPVGGPTSMYHIAFARLKLQKKETTDAEERLNEALQFDYQNPDAWALMGHVKYMIGDTENAKDCYERTISFLHDASEMHSIYLRLASIYLQDQRFQDAKNVFLMACKKSASCVSWLGVGIACYRLNELGEAEDALSEANILNNADPEVWAYLSLVCLKTGRQLEAEQAYKYAIKLNLQDTDLLNEIQSVQQQVGFGNPEF
ncbi:Cilia- and flagella-associated protein 70 [Mytilus edulis]|uniref:Cilia- and flagella-associated protein 70 n=1 Tax=Mytilus edulis TaxID=6550 RepID=A0A8S3QIT4_MYTED|nr:Cilia- and flagella-associated protein 70 [Mytilus edulis]